MYDELKDSDGRLSVAGHRLDPRTLRCVAQRDGSDCNRHLNEILSDTPHARIGQPHIACYGGLTAHELETLQRAYAVRARIFEAAL